MKKINLNVYQLFLKHGNECLWASDSSRVSRPKETSEETDKMFMIIEAVDHKFELINSNCYSEELKATYQKEIDELKMMFYQDVFELLKNKYHIKPNSNV